MLNADTTLVTLQALLDQNNVTTTERYSKLHNAKVKRDYFKAMSEITSRASEKSICRSDYNKFFTQDKRLEVFKNFSIANTDD
jgi:hypothetical protein